MSPSEGQINETNSPSSLDSPPPPMTGFSPSHEYLDKVFYRFHQHTLSDSTATTASNDSSPTTTVSTADDSSATEPSPGSSPESPPPTTFTTGMLRPRTSDDATAPFFELQKQPPPRRGRNLKNLAVNTSRQTAKASSNPSLPLEPALDTDTLSELASPAFVKPPSPPKRKGTNLGLTLLTPGSGKVPPQDIRLAIPPTPGLGRPGMLRHFQSSPSLPLFPSVTGHALSHARAHIPSSLETILSPVEAPAVSDNDGREVIEEEQNFDVPLSREEKQAAYPEGPICVYEPGIDLYLEPTAEQAREYDVVMNVASEVRNPFLTDAPATTEEPDIRIDGGGGIQYAPKRPAHLAVLTSTNAAGAVENSPTTPKATPLNALFPATARSDPIKPDPEYIHIPWEHNSDIVPDLLRLVKLIDDKAKQGKRVLVHCQCGVSRSASLVVAYGLYKDPAMSVQEAYDAVKQRSKWIGPNMNLIMQLQEFRTSLTRGGILSCNRGLSPITPSSAFGEWRSPFSANTSSLAAEARSVMPMTAGVASPPTDSDKMAPIVSPGPSSAPSGLQWPASNDAVPPVPLTQRARAISAVKPATAYVDPSGHVVPVLHVAETTTNLKPRPAPIVIATSVRDATKDDSGSATPTDSLSSPRSSEFAMTALQPSGAVAPADDFGIMSPTSTSFTSTSFDRPALLASLGMGSMQPLAAPAPQRSRSLRSDRRRTPPPEDASSLSPPVSGSPKQLRGRISSPSLRQQQRLQELQSRIEASLPNRQPQPEISSSPGFDGIDEALMSPRATEFTKNPFALALALSGEQRGQKHTGAPPSSAAGLSVPRSDTVDPRSPAQTGASPITRSIFDVL